MQQGLLAAILALSTSGTCFSQTSFWTNATIPAVPEAGYDASPVTLGLTFYSNVTGSVTGIRFYKGPHNAGVHVGNLWSGTGVKLAEVVFSGETASGWQQAAFFPAVNIAANTPYVISYLAPNGNYSFDDFYPWPTLSSASLHSWGDTPSVYSYGAASSFPDRTWNQRNYWVDVVFSSAAASGAKTFWTNAAVPAVTEAAYDTNSVTLGLTFYSDVGGAVAGVRFYKGPHNTGVHFGDLWSGTGTKLAESVFSQESESGWQQAAFSPPVNIAANTPYVISYLAPSGNYPFDDFYPWPGVAASPLHPWGNTPSVYAYGAASSFPDRTWNQRNYWVDVVFTGSAGSLATPPVYSISGIVSGSPANLTLSGTAAGVAVTDGFGNYNFPGVPNGGYVVAPSQPGYYFVPPVASVIVAGASLSGINFTAIASPTSVSQPPAQPGLSQHSVSLSWEPSTSFGILGYHIYRASASEGPYVRLSTYPLQSLFYIDASVISGGTYYYVATAVDISNGESPNSNEAVARVP
ncbi:MAG: DUF4082 domain-containing protein [Bryobacteraceae bacterium]